jgi:hypothetical protein
VTDAPLRPARSPDVRVGSMQNGLGPVSVAERSLGAGAMQWVSLAAIALAAVAADQLTKTVVTSHLSLDEGDHIVGIFWIHHVQNSGIAFGLFSSATAAVIGLTAIAVSPMTAAVALEKSPNAMPEFCTWWIESGPATWRSPSSERWLETMCFVSWSPPSAASAIAERPAHCWARAANER